MNNIKYRDILSIVALGAIVLVVWGISQATDKGNLANQGEQNYSAMGTVDSITSNSFNFTVQQDSNGNSGPMTGFDLSKVEKIESKDYVQLSLNDLKAGDTLIVQGIADQGQIILNRIIDFSWSGIFSNNASTTATSSASLIDATTTPLNVTSTSSEVISNASSTDTVATSTATSTDNIGTSTPDPVASSTVSNTVAPDLSSSTPVSTPVENTPPVVDPGTSTATDTSAPTN